MASKFISKFTLLSSSVDPPSQPTITVTDLPEVHVLHLLRRNGYSGVSYYDLGFYLGLSYDTLEAIARNNKGDAEGGLHDCLTKWLQNVDDVQKTKGGPTISSLVSALRGIRENGVADGIDIEIHPACRILARYTSDQSLLSALPQLAALLYWENVIKEDTLSSNIQGDVLLVQIKEIVCADYRKLEVFAEILCKFKATAEIGYSIMKEYRALSVSHSFQEEDTKKMSSSDPVIINRSPHTAPPPIPNSTFRGDIAHKAMTECTGMIKDYGIDLHFLVDKLLEHKIISAREKKKITDGNTRQTAGERMDELLQIISRTVKRKGGVFGIFLEILREEDTVRTIALAEDLMEKYFSLERDL